MYDSIIPTADTIPVHWLWFQVLLIFTFFVHMILMNFILGGSLLTLWDVFRGRKTGKNAGSIPTLIALTVNFGVPPLLFVQVLYGHLFYSSSVMVAVTVMGSAAMGTQLAQFTLLIWGRVSPPGFSTRSLWNRGFISIRP